MKNFFAALKLRKFKNEALRATLDLLMASKPSAFTDLENEKSRAVALIILELVRRKLSVNIEELDY